MPINITSLTTEQLVQLNSDVVALIKARRRQEAGSMRRELSLGDTVNVNERHRTSTGIIRKIMRTRALVEINGVDYKVPMSMLSHKA
jgi:ribosomal protein S1